MDNSDNSTPKEQTIFHAALAVDDPSQRRRLVESLCAGDQNLLQQVEELLAAHDDRAELKSPAASAAAELDAVDDLGPGKSIGRYKLLEQIGEGGFGAVFMAEQVEPLQRRVAVKVIKAGMDTKQVIGRFEAERQALALMDHPNIAKVIDAGATENGRPFFVMELVRGVDVTTFCDQQGISTAERLQIFMDICAAIQHAHQKGIIHRDIKPSNILASDDGDRVSVKVIDFGIAKATQGKLTDKTLFTQFRQLMGTPAYMSPEQARMSAVDVDTRSDVYSLGVLLYELLTGTTPFDSQQLLAVGYEEMCRYIREEEPIAPSTRISSLSLDAKSVVAKSRRAEPVELEHTIRGELDWIVMKALEKGRARRYETADALKLDVQRFLANEPVLAAAPSTAYQLAKFARRNRGPIIAVGSIATLLVLGIVVSSWQAIRATWQRRRADTAERIATENATRAEANEELARRNQYAAEMMVAQSGASGVTSANVYDLLRKQIPKPGEPDFRGFEWRLLWNNYRRQLFSLDGHTDEIRTIDMSPDGIWLASGSTDGTARLWNMPSRREVWRCSEGDDCNQVAFSPDGKLLLTRWWSRTKKRAILWDVSDPTRPAQVRDVEPFTAFSPDGRTVLDAWTTINQRDLESGEVVREYADPAFGDTQYVGQGHQAGIWNATFSKDGTRLLTVGRDWQVKLWDTENGELLCRMQGDTNEVVDGALSPIGNTIVTVSLSGAIRVWDADGNETRLIQNRNAVEEVKFNADGTRLIVCEMLGRLHVFETDHWTKIASFDSRAALDILLVCSPVDANVAVTAYDSIRVWDVSPETTVLEHPSPVRALEFSPDGEKLAVGTANGVVQFWNVAERSKLFATEATHEVAPFKTAPPIRNAFKPGFVTFSPDSRRAAVIGPPETIRVWNLVSQEFEAELDAPPEARTFMSLAFSASGSRIFSGTVSATDKLGTLVWSLASPEQPSRFLPQYGYFGIMAMALSPGGTTLATGGADVMIWDIGSHSPIRTLELTGVPDMGRAVVSVCFSPDGKWLAAGTANSEVWLWDTNSWSHRRLPFISNVMSIDFSPDSTRLVAADMWMTVKMWDVKSLQPIATFGGSIASFSPDGTILAVGCETNLSSIAMPESGRVRLYHAPRLEAFDE